MSHPTTENLTPGGAVGPAAPQTAPTNGPAVVFERRVAPGASGADTTGAPGDPLVAAADADYRANPAGSPPPEDEPRRRGLGRARAPRPVKGQPKPAKPKSKAQIKRERDLTNRKLATRNRFRGDRWKFLSIVGALLCLALIAPLALLIAASKPSNSEIAAIVDKQLAASGRDFPTGQAVMWAGQVIRVWGTWNEDSADARKVLMAPYLSQGMDAQAGWNERGKQNVLFASVNPEPVISDATHASVKATYQIDNGTWRCVSVPIFAYHPDTFTGEAPWAFALAGNPVPDACTPRTGSPSLDIASAKGLKADTETGRTLSAEFYPGFFSAWAASDANALRQYTASGVTTMGLGGAMASIPSPTIGDATLLVDQNGIIEGKVYVATVPVTWTVAGSTSQVTAVYEVPMKRIGDRWQVAGEPTAAPQANPIGSNGPASVPEPGEGVTPDGSYPSSNTTPSKAPSSVNPSSGTGQ